MEPDSSDPPQADLNRLSATTNSIYLKTTISKPDVASIIQAVATIIHSQMLEVSSVVYLLGLERW